MAVTMELAAAPSFGGEEFHYQPPRPYPDDRVVTVY
jgi:hypothetical protein